MTRKLQNQLLYELACFIPYKREREISETIGEYLAEISKIKNGPILSSSILKHYIKNNWSRVKENRKKKIEALAKSMKEIGRIDSFDKRCDQIFILSDLRWYWDMPIEKDDLLLCTYCFEWDRSDFKEFTLCINNVHTIHKNCSRNCILKRLFNDDYCDHATYDHELYSPDLCLLCNPLYDHPPQYNYLA